MHGELILKWFVLKCHFNETRSMYDNTKKNAKLAFLKYWLRNLN